MNRLRSPLGRGAALAPLATSFCCVLAPLPLSAQQAQAGVDTLRVHILDPLFVEGRSDGLISIAGSASEGTIGYRDFRLRPLLREGELLETVPGLILTQHSGGGKSNQMFARGFNLDHGTDFATFVQGMPVNLPAHAHGHGYTDVNFLVPELVDHVDYRLGIHYAEIGDFGVAGGAHVELRREMERPLFAATLGSEGYRRFVGAGSTPLGAGTLLAGGEVRLDDGPWEVAQELRKYSGLVRYSRETASGSISLVGLGYSNEWNASDQIPLRLVEGEQLDRFGQVDPTLGGSTSRASLSLNWTRRGVGTGQRVDLYGIHYDLDLFSNFTFGLEDPDEGDQFRQEDRGRVILGANLAHVQAVGRHTVTAGLQTRLDRFDVALTHSRERVSLEGIREDEGTVSASGIYLESESRWTPDFRSILGVRADHHRFDVTSDLPPNSGKASATILSPKLSLAYMASPRIELYVSAGMGFHSNSANGVVQQIDPGTGEEADPADPLVRGRGAELGLRTSAGEGWRSTLSLWTVELDSELLFAGDEGATEPSDPSRRFGVTWANFYRLTPSLTAELDLSLARARFLEVAEGEDRIPGALQNVVAAGLTWEAEGGGPFAALRLRRFGDYPLVEDNSERANATALLNLNLGWALGDLRIGLAVLNLLDGKGSDIEYFYESRLAGEPLDGVEDVHFRPIEPRRLRFTLSWGL